MILSTKIPQPSGKNIAIRIKPAAERAVRHSHPWIFDQSIRRQSHEGQAGDLAIIFDKRDRFLAAGLYDPYSPIRIRVLQFGKPAPINEEWFRQRVIQAYELRKTINKKTTTAFRLIHGENDGLPGFVVDKYSDDYVIRLDTIAWIPYLHLIGPIVVQESHPERLILRLARNIQAFAESRYDLTDGHTLFGLPYEQPTSFYENGLLFEADLVHGQKTGFFLDQRENRARVESLTKANELQHVLNVFAYTGGFSLYVARGGAVDVTSVDQSMKALKMAQSNFKLNSYNQAIVSANHRIIQGDAFRILEQLANAGKRYDMVILDPPSFAKAQEEAASAQIKYSRLVQLGLGVLKSGGYLVAASCSSRVSADTFAEIVNKSAQSAGRYLHLIKQTGHPADHPIAFPEGAYLKCVFAVVE